MDDDEYERSDFEELVSGKVIKVQMEHYKDVGYPDGAGTKFDAWAVLGWTMNASDAVQGKKKLPNEPYDGADGPESFFRDYPEVKKILDDPEIAAVRDDEIKKSEDEFESCWGVNWDRNEIAFLMFTAVANEDDYNISDEENFARQDANAFCGVKHIIHNKAIENQFDEKEETIRRHTKPADMGMDHDVRKVMGEMKVSTTYRDVNVYNSIHFARSILYYGKKHDRNFMVKVLSGCMHIAESEGFKDRRKEKLVKFWMKEFGINENEIRSVPQAASYGASPSSGCFIATAAYGTPFAEEIDVLRNWRDDFLEASYPGRLFIRTYYSLSPPVADNISESDGKRKIVRTALGPIVKVLKDKYSN
jgi:hypothetical protein|tara:strand:+ start:230 stop:1315 length:1086 start_codon:yes stop_codon:yes gene_type:complete